MAYKFKLEKTLHNEYLNEHVSITARNIRELEVKERKICEKWDRQEKKKRELEKIELLKKEAQQKTQEAELLFQCYRNLLKDTLDEYQKKSPPLYPEFEFSALQEYEEIKREYKVPTPNFLEYFFSFIEKNRLEKERQAEAAYQLLVDQYTKQKEMAIQNYHSEKSQYETGESTQIEQLISSILNQIEIPFSVHKEYEVQFDSTSKDLIISYFLPKTSDFPNIVGYKYIANKLSIVPIELKRNELEELYEEILMQIILKILYEVVHSFYTDIQCPVNAIIFNGWIRSIHPGTGKEITSCILSLHVTIDEFKSLNLYQASPKACVQHFKALVTPSLAEYTPIKPIMHIRREDSRFIMDKDVLSLINTATNLAEMDWEDFEHLVRQLFEKEFCYEGCEVKTTKKSHDGGVDCIILDQDPIRGGKIVVQAKRYNKVVPPSAVRDLYGTYMNEGALKGILVTTSHFGKESHDFIRDKPITLIDGEALKSLFYKHGYNVKIELQKK